MPKKATFVVGSLDSLQNLAKKLLAELRAYEKRRKSQHRSSFCQFVFSEMDIKLSRFLLETDDPHKNMSYAIRLGKEYAVKPQYWKVIVGPGNQIPDALLEIVAEFETNIEKYLE